MTHARALPATTTALLAASAMMAIALPQAVSGQDPAAEETAAIPDTTLAAALTGEARSIYLGWPADRRATYDAWPAEYRDYYWTLTPNQRRGWWRMTADQRAMIFGLSSEQRRSAWQIVEARLGPLPAHLQPQTR